MNFLTFVLALLVVLTLGVLSIREKFSTDRSVSSTYLGHLVATRKILSKAEAETYQSLKGVSNPPEEKKKTSGGNPRTPHLPKINPECARLNLWPLIQEGREEHPLLYELTAKFLKTFYSSSLLEGKTGSEYAFLDLFLKKARAQKGVFPLEKLSLGNPQWQAAYYKMLKGTKDAQIPSLLDFIAVEEGTSKICLSHAHPYMIALFFGPKAADRMFQELHREKPPLLTKEWVENICSESHLIALDPRLFDLLELGRPKPHPKKGKTTWIEEDETSHISLRKNIYRNKKPG